MGVMETEEDINANVVDITNRITVRKTFGRVFRVIGPNATMHLNIKTM